MLDVGGLSETVGNARRVHYARVTAGSPTASDLVYALDVHFDDPGPRNF